MNFSPRIEFISKGSYEHVLVDGPTPSHARYNPSLDYVDRFYAHLNKWISETYYLSSATELQEHPSFMAIVRIGNIAIPLILNELGRKPSLLSLALRQITGEIPYDNHDRGDVRAMANAWIAWGQRNGY